jgi:hypothetical protein
MLGEKGFDEPRLGLKIHQRGVYNNGEARSGLLTPGHMYQNHTRCHSLAEVRRGWAPQKMAMTIVPKRQTSGPFSRRVVAATIVPKP